MGNSRILTDNVFNFHGKVSSLKINIGSPSWALTVCKFYYRFLGGRLQTGSHSPHALHDHLNSWLGCIMIQWTWCIIPRTPHKTYPCLCGFRWIKFDPPPPPPRPPTLKNTHTKRRHHQAETDHGAWFILCPGPKLYSTPLGLGWAWEAAFTSAVWTRLGWEIWWCHHCRHVTHHLLYSTSRPYPLRSGLTAGAVPWNLVQAMLGTSLGLRYRCGLHLSQDSQV